MFWARRTMGWVSYGILGDSRLSAGLIYLRLGLIVGRSREWQWARLDTNFFPLDPAPPPQGKHAGFQPAGESKPLACLSMPMFKTSGKRSELIKRLAAGEPHRFAGRDLDAGCLLGTIRDVTSTSRMPRGSAGGGHAFHGIGLLARRCR